MNNQLKGILINIILLKATSAICTYADLIPERFVSHPLNQLRYRPVQHLKRIF